MYLHNHMGFPIAKKKYYGKPIMDIPATAAELYGRVSAAEPFCAARIGGNELKAMVSLQKEFKNAAERKLNYDNLRTLAGFFGTMEDYAKYGRLMEESLQYVDLCGVWFNQMEDYILKHYGNPEMKYGRLEGLEPWYCPEKPWTAALKGKKVCVIHPFAESIIKQYDKRDSIFPGTEILPEFELRVVKAVQTMLDEELGRFESWFDALDHMYEEAMKEDFDVALIACGAYGLPLGARLRKAGRCAVHWGGSLQLLFGIMGGRWENMAELKPYVNESWTRPAATEGLSRGVKDIENGCYW